LVSGFFKKLIMTNDIANKIMAAKKYFFIIHDFEITKPEAQFIFCR
jgi:hypothetical protein